MTAHVDRNGKLPIYHQIAMSLQQRIAQHEWQIGERLPNEYDLAEMYGVSRVTVRQALTELEKEGIVVRKRPSGTFISRIPEMFVPTVSVMVDIMESLSQAGHTTAISTLFIGSIDDGPPAARTFLEMPERASFAVIRRIITANDRPFAWVQTFASEQRFPGLASATLKNNSLQQTMSELFGVVARSADHWVEADTAAALDTELLGIEPGTLIMKLDSAFVDQHGGPMAFMVTRMLASSMRLHLKSTTPGPLLDPRSRAW